MLSARRSLLLLFCLDTLGASVANGATCDVPSDYALMPDAVDDAACTEIVVASGYYAGGVLTLDIDRNLIIRGAGKSDTFLNYHLLVTNDAVLTLEDLSIDGFGPPHGVELSSNAAGVIGHNITIFGSLGWGIENTFGVPTGDTFAILNDCAVYGNAGGINVGSLTMSRCEVYGNNLHGGVSLFRNSTIHDSEIYNNQQANTTDDGAGILFNGFNFELLIEHSKVHDNTTFIDPLNATADGGGIMVRRGNVIVRDCEIYNNVAARRGGGIAVHDIFDTSLLLEDSTVRDNVAYEGGGGLSVGNDTIVRTSRITNNTARYNINFNANGLGSGGGVYVYDSPTLEIYDTTINQNMTDSATSVLPSNAGGGIYAAPNFLNGTIRVERSTISENYAQTEGGGVYGREGTTLRNVTVANNRADGDGGGVYSENTTTFLQLTTVVGNVADFDADGFGDGGGLAGVIRTDHALVALNSDLSSPAAEDCSGGNVLSLGYSILGVSDGCPNFKQTGTDQVGEVGDPLDPVLSLPLAANGGPTRSFALKPDSPALDAGSPTCLAESLDQRGGTRPLDGDGDATVNCDIGAIEFRADSCIAGPVVISGPEFFAGQSQVSSTTTLSTTGEVAIIVGSETEFIADDAGSIGLGNGFYVETGGQFSAALADTTCPP